MSERNSISGIAIDCGGTKTAVAKFANGDIVKRLQIETATNATPAQLIDGFAELVRQLNPTRDERICAALTGRVDQHGIWHSVNQSTLGSINKVPIADMLEQRFQRKVPVINDATAGAIAEHRFGSGVGCTRMAYITVSTGVGAGIIIDSKPLLSPNGLAGHVGFASSSLSTRLCGSGRRGTVESIASGKAIAELSLQAGYSSDPIDVFSAFRRGESWATDIVTVSASAVAELTADLVAMLDLELFVLGGSIGLAEGYLEQLVKAQYGFPDLFRVPILKASLDDAVLIGALTALPGA